MQGSARGVTVGVKVLLSRFKASHGLVLSVHLPISFFQFLSVVLSGVFFWLGGLIFGGTFRIMGFVLVATFVSQRLESAYH